MTILGVFLNNQLRTGGNRRYLELMEELALRGNRVFVIMNPFFDYTPRFFGKIPLSVKYRRRGFPPASFLFKKAVKKKYAEITAAFGGGKPDFIHIHGDTHLKAALFLRDALGVPLFYAFRANDIDRARVLRLSGALNPGELLFSYIMELINRSRERRIAESAELITFQNTGDRDSFIKRTGCDLSKIIVIPGNIGPPRFSPEWENKNKSVSVKKLLYIGSLSSGKGLGEFLKAAELLKKRGLGFLFCIILGRLENYKPAVRLIKKLDIEEMVSLEGFKDPFPYLADCDLMVYPTRYDAFPDTALEALHAGCPVIASAVGGIPDMLLYPELLFEYDNIREIADKIERCLRDPAFYKRLRELCAERAAVYRFNWAERFEAAMEQRKKAGDNPGRNGTQRESF
jgi:glycosyltransferase involved in cell wall biosynthesis